MSPSPRRQLPFGSTPAPSAEILSPAGPAGLLWDIGELQQVLVDRQRPAGSSQISLLSESLSHRTAAPASGVGRGDARAPPGDRVCAGGQRPRQVRRPCCGDRQRQRRCQALAGCRRHDCAARGWLLLHASVNSTAVLRLLERNVAGKDTCTSTGRSCTTSQGFHYVHVLFMRRARVHNTATDSDSSSCSLLVSFFFSKVYMLLCLL